MRGNTSTRGQQPDDQERVGDAELLRGYAEGQSEAAFAELVRRHLDLVFSAALRQVGGDVHRAHDVSQIVFTTLAHKAGSLVSHPVLVGWLYTATQHAAAKAVRTESRRRARELEAHLMQETQAAGNSDIEWDHIRPLLDRAMRELDTRDREAVLLRFFARRPFAEIGRNLNLTEDAARMRVERALEKLHALLARRGVTSTAAALAVTLSGQAVVAAPTALAATVTSAALAATGAAAGAGAVTLMASITLQVGVAGAIVAAGVIGLTLQLQTNAALRSELAALRIETSAVAGLRAEGDSLRRRVAEVDVLRGDDVEFARLRDEVERVKERLAQAARAEAAARAAHEANIAAQPVFAEAQLDAKPKARRQAPPKFPAELRKAGGRGEALLSLVVGADGKVRDVQVLRSTSSAIAEASIAAVKQWQYDPGQKDGRAVNARLQIPMVFTMQEFDAPRKAAMRGERGWNWF